MTTLSFRFFAAFALVLSLAAPLAHAESPAAEQAEVEAQDAPPPVVHTKKAPIHAQDGADLIDSSDADEPDEIAPTPMPTEKPEVSKASGSAPAASGNAAAVSDDVPTTPAINKEPEDIATKTKKAIEKVTEKKDISISASASKAQKVPLGSLTMRQPTLQLNQLSLWRADGDKASSNDVWDGTDALDVAAILPALVAAKNQHVKDILLRIATSAVYSPAGMTDMDYVRWRAAVLMAQKKPDLAARLMNSAHLGRDVREDLQRRVGYELAAGEIEAACVESMAAGDNLQPMWQGMAILCAQHLGDTKAAKALTDALLDGAVKAAASGSSDDLKDAVIKLSGAVPTPKIIPDNEEILSKLSQLLADGDAAPDNKIFLKENKGQLLLLSLGALRAEKHGADTQKLTDQALSLTGL